MYSVFKKILQQRRPVRFLVSRVLLRLRIHVPITVWYSKKYDVRVWLTPMPIAHKAFLDDSDVVTEAVFAKFIRDDSIVFDVGANIGTHALLAARLAEKGKVFAIEPGKQAFADLTENQKLNNISNVHPVFGAISEVPGTMELFEHAFSNEKNFLVTQDMALDSGGGKTAEVPVFRLDDLLEKHSVKTINFLKIDVEGLEVDVLRSLGERIADVQTIYFEYSVTNYSRYDHTFAEVEELLSRAGFSLYAPRLSEDVVAYTKLSAGDEERKRTKNIVATRVAV